MEQADVLATLEMVASDQWGIVTTAQAGREGVERLQLSRLAEKGDLERARHGVYLLPSHQAGPEDEIRAAWLSLEPKKFIDERWEDEWPVVVTHESAARIHGIGRLIPPKLTFSTGSTKQTRQQGIRIYTRREFAEADIVSVNGLPVTSVTRTVGDLAEQKIERGYLADLVADALRKENVRIDDLAEKLTPAARSYGAKTGMQLVSELSAEASSVEDIVERRNRFVHGTGLTVDELYDAGTLKAFQENIVAIATYLERMSDPLEKRLKEIVEWRPNGDK
ncbi:type IV toxin-antitoxin system AbiEi family antitoxin domain-containing protein [Corynebacterium haemomassiliense]|uniref:Type IV toxin-antitoxin system AbiEi family antitoxin domain-containing protein n=1 Tax=Corynebacterium haemomassiliense TaxID=2754726 RepID=A0A7W2EAM7_9CORY|nr:type IV toxin-antitoxin system AbiEi family antitoxin domain-containing protein [Corynebacterium haemomassiliense]MBA5244200.1 type IV toxin-antitoxin system AbiEi family antitoxin domain-containing protein [Corynebacterium haemomassiliense]